MILGRLQALQKITLPNTARGPISTQKMTEYLKELGLLAEVEQDIINTQTEGGKRKWEPITTHTARRSFATNA